MVRSVPSDASEYPVRPFRLARALGGGWLGLLLLLAGPVAHAETCPAIAGAADGMEEVDAEARLAYLAEAFDRQIHGLHTWSYSWGSIYSFAAGAQLGILNALKDPGTRTDLWIGTASALFGAATLFLLPLRILTPLEDVRSKWSTPDRCKLLAEAEHVLIQNAREQGVGKSWLGQVGSVLVNVALLLISGLGYGRWKSGAISGGIGLFIGELNLQTQPTLMNGVLRNYRSGKLEPFVPPWIFGVQAVPGMNPSGSTAGAVATVGFNLP